MQVHHYLKGYKGVPVLSISKTSLSSGKQGWKGVRCNLQQILAAALSLISRHWFLNNLQLKDLTLQPISQLSLTTVACLSTSTISSTNSSLQEQPSSNEEQILTEDRGPDNGVLEAAQRLQRLVNRVVAPWSKRQLLRRMFESTEWPRHFPPLKLVWINIDVTYIA